MVIENFKIELKVLKAKFQKNCDIFIHACIPTCQERQNDDIFAVEKKKLWYIQKDGDSLVGSLDNAKTSKENKKWKELFLSRRRKQKFIHEAKTYVGYTCEDVYEPNELFQRFETRNDQTLMKSSKNRSKICQKTPNNYK